MPLLTGCPRPCRPTLHDPSQMLRDAPLANALLTPNADPRAPQPRGLRRRPSSARLRRCDQGFRRNAPFAVQPPSHSHREGTLPRQDVGCALARTEQAAKIGLGIAAGFHAVTNRINCIRRIDRPAPALVVFDDQCQKVETIGVRRARRRFAFEVSLNLFERRFVLGFGVKWTDHFFRHETVSGSMWSYSAWVPMNFTSKRPNANETWTTKRYLLPPRSKITRLSPTKSTVPPKLPFYFGRI